MRALRRFPTVRCSTRPCHCFRAFHTTSPRRSRLSPLPILPSVSLETFLSEAFIPEKPAQLPQGPFTSLPAISKWFRPKNGPKSKTIGGGGNEAQELNTDYLAQLGDTMMPMELTTAGGGEDKDVGFTRTEAPFSLFLSLLSAQGKQQTPGPTNFSNSTTPAVSPPKPTRGIYIAQCPLPSLPLILQNDLPEPPFVQHAGKGEIYDSSIWLGPAPTYTPLHKDPNPNLFVQLAGVKIIRIYGPDVGGELFRRGGGEREGSEEMMSSQARTVLEELVWGSGMEDQGGQLGYEAVVRAGDGVFIPKGWWHSIKGVGEGVVGSVNWWFR